MTRFGVILSLCLSLLTAAATAQQGPVHGPCLQVLPNPTDYIAAFEAEGWTLVEGAERTAALEQISLLRYLSDSLIAPPATPSELADARAVARTERFLRWYELALVLTRGDAVAVIDFNDGRSLRSEMNLKCWIGAPDLPELDTLTLDPVVINGPTAVAAFSQDLLPPAGAISMRIDALRFVAGYEPAETAEAVVVSIGRQEPRYVLPQLYGLLRAFGQDEYADALRGNIE